ncbi:DUF7281 domain-containing protein [Marinobacter xiaoshiensis]|uniref:DUF7281 domain-containing protein n=1 Tax=Marinobacter xiaoshiensis TaxID=3073652 RepID=A0ABU2HL80_9GAMM|nr:hypothetical protein [Marinobacter sp. F60267]MDS1311518.1 hypothetical protein [Marinobacter sp. F60267]
MPAEIAAIERLLRGGKSTVKRGKIWDQICAETGVGQVVGKEIHFTPEERLRLREYAKAEHGLDPQYDSRAGGRMAMARHDASEKYSRDSVFGELLVLATAGAATVRVKGKSVSTPPGSVLSVRPDCLDPEHLQTQSLVIIENGGLMPYWVDIKLPDSLANSIILYRGHRENVRSVAELVSSQPADKLSWFFDFDPAGQCLALDQGKGSTLVPASWRELGKHTPFNQPKVHRNQSVALTRLKGRAYGELLAIAEHMASEELAVMQEHMVRRNILLSALPLA